MDDMVQQLHACFFIFLRVFAMCDVTEHAYLVCRRAAVGHVWLVTTCQCTIDNDSMQPDITASDSRRIAVARSEKDGRAVDHLRNVASTSNMTGCLLVRTLRTFRKPRTSAC